MLLQCDVLRIITLHTHCHCQLRTMEGREYKSGPILIFKFKHKRTLSMYVRRNSLLSISYNKMPWKYREKQTVSLNRAMKIFSLESQKGQRQSEEKQRFSFHVWKYKVQSVHNHNKCLDIYKLFELHRYHCTWPPGPQPSTWGQIIAVSRPI